MRKFIGMALVVSGLATAALAQTAPVPEIDGAFAVSALTLIAGAALVIRGRKQ